MAESLHMLLALASGTPLRHRLPYLDDLTLEVECIS
jgi:hypothetical protein